MTAWQQTFIIFRYRIISSTGCIRNRNLVRDADRFIFLLFIRMSQIPRFI